MVTYGSFTAAPVSRVALSVVLPVLTKDQMNGQTFKKNNYVNGMIQSMSVHGENPFARI